MKTLFWAIALCALAVGLVVAARYNEGYALLVLPPYRVEISLNLLMVLLAVAFVLLYSLIRLVATAVLIPSRVREYRRTRRQDNARAALITAFEAYFEGRYAKAEQSATQALELGEHARLLHVLAARAAHGLRAHERRDEHLRRAAEGAPEDDALRIVSEAELRLDERRPGEALDALQSLPRKHTAALRLELRARQQLRQWDHVAALLNELEKRNVFEAEQAAELRTHALAENIRRRGLDGHALDETWKKIPEAQKRETRVATAAAERYLALGRKAEAQHIIEQSLEATWDSVLIAAYADCAGPDPVRQIERAESWLGAHPREAALLVMLGKLCARQGLWGKAESYLEAGISIEPSYDAHLELARLHEKLGNPDAARRHYRQSLELALSALRDASPPVRPHSSDRPVRQPARSGFDALEVEQRR